MKLNNEQGAHGLLPFVKYSYPLADNGLNRAACISIFRKLVCILNFLRT